MARDEEGLQSEALQGALKEAIGGRPTRLEDLLARHGAVLTPKPNLKLAAAFGVEMAAFAGAASPLLTRLAGDDAAPDDPRSFIPIAAAFGWAGRVRVGREVDEAWTALAHLAADERSAVRLGTLEAFIALGARDGGADELVQQAIGWIDAEDRELRFGSAALVIDTLADRRVLASVRRQKALFDYLSRAVTEAAEAPRSADRSDARRRLLMALPRTLAAVVASAADRGRQWFEAHCVEATHPQLRAVLSDTLVRLRAPSLGQTEAVVNELRKSLEGSAKPLRDPTRLRPGQGRGKATRRTR